MDKPWFGRKRIGWGWGLPVRWEGWLVFILYYASMVASFTLILNKKLALLSAILFTIIFILVIRKTSGKPQWGTLWDTKTNKKVTAIIAVFLAALIFFVVIQISFLNRAHSSFDNYYKFRGCVQLLEKTNTYGVCKLSSGEIIKIVLYNGKWYLDKDLPYPGINFL